LQRSPRDLDVCLLADGIDAWTIGGVSRWANGLAAHLPSVAFAIAPSTGDLPAARVYHALTPAAAARAGRAVRATGRPLLLTCHAMSDAWRPEGLATFALDSSAGGGGGGHDGGDHDDHDDHNDDHEDHGDHGDNEHGKGHVALERRGYAAADMIGAVSRAVASSHVAAGASAERMLVIPNGAPHAATFAALSEPLVGFVGRIAPVKGVPRLLRAMRLVRADRPDARLVVIGPNEASDAYLRRLRRLASQPGLRGAVRFVGPSRPELWYPRLACLALASESEGMPLVLLEAMAHGVPCVAPDVGGVRDTLGSAGVIVAPRDVDALAAGILRVLDDAADAARLAAAGRARAARWSAGDAAAAYEALYRQLGVPCRTSSC
jgi:glycosyltransferase involved in cell wall biosynthesis